MKDAGNMTSRGYHAPLQLAVPSEPQSGGFPRTLGQQSGRNLLESGAGAAHQPLHGSQCGRGAPEAAVWPPGNRAAAYDVLRATEASPGHSTPSPSGTEAVTPGLTQDCGSQAARSQVLNA